MKTIKVLGIIYKVCSVGNCRCYMCFSVNGNILAVRFFNKEIGSTLENQNFEKRIAITPDLVKKYISLGFDVCLIENYGSHLGIKDEEFKDKGAKSIKR